MKFKKLISTALIAASVFTCVAAAMPIKASAAYSDVTHTTNDATTAANAKEAVASIAGRYSYETAEEMLNTELAAGYLDSCQMTNDNGEVYTVYVNRYTGMMYYVNGTTGQILTSNPYDTNIISVSGDADKNIYVQQLKSQILLTYTPNSQMTDNTVLLSSYQAAVVDRYQISVTPIANGLRVNYTLGDTSRRPLFPYGITYEEYYENFFSPIYNDLMELLGQYSTDRTKYDFFAIDTFNGEPTITHGGIYNHATFKDFCATSSAGSGAMGSTKVMGVIADAIDRYMIRDPEAQAQAKELLAGLSALVQSYAVQNPYEHSENWNEKLLETMYATYPITQGQKLYDYEDDVVIMTVNSTDAIAKETHKRVARWIRAYCPDYTFAMMYDSEEACNVTVAETDKPVFRCAIEYRLDTDGTLLVSLPASSISFDATKYTLRSISVLPYFGAGNVNDENGYAFYPDGSGTVIEFNDFYNDLVKETINRSSSVYGEDYCYSNINGKLKKPITMPVYGVVNDVPANQTTIDTFGLDAEATVTNGYFCIMEEGASLATFNVNMYNSIAYLGMYSSYTPYAVDSFDLSSMIASATSDLYYITSEVPYSGSYTQRFVMLRDADLNPTQDAYVSSYIGMANYYRDYLEANGVLKALTEADITEQMPLYIETLGSMEIDDTFLTFPIKRDIPLTSFEDIETMYKDLLAVGIKNVNFRMTSFANGGMYATYPVKLRWERACGGKRDFKALVEYANSLSKENGEVLGLYPEFDFMYINYTSLFDGIGRKNNVSRMLDNRYAVQRVLDSSTNTMTDSFSAVIAAEALEKLYTKFNKKYQKYDVTGLSVSTMGSDLSSNFDEEAPVDREQQMHNVMATLKTMSERYSLMMDTGNAYVLSYADHLLNVSIDSSHFRTSSYSVPFLGMVLHGYVNYTGTALNNSGAPEYDILRSIENGASLYYILCYQNIEHMKEYEVTSKYYSVDYQNWFDDMVENYKKVNAAIGGDLQTYKITDHKLLIGERVVSAEERRAFYRELADEYITMIETQLKQTIDRELAYLQMTGSDKSLGITVDQDALYAQFVADLMLDSEDPRYALEEAFKTELTENFVELLATLVAPYEAEYPVDDTVVEITFDAINYQPQNNYLTSSEATDGNAYETTVFTSDNGNIVMVTYSNDAGEATSFLLNYNIFSVTVTFDGKTYTLGKYEFKPIEGGV